LPEGLVEDGQRPARGARDGRAEGFDDRDEGVERLVLGEVGFVHRRAGQLVLDADGLTVLVGGDLADPRRPEREGRQLVEERLQRTDVVRPPVEPDLADRPVAEIVDRAFHALADELHRPDVSGPGGS
jgi:hypothetical protein